MDILESLCGGIFIKKIKIMEYEYSSEKYYNELNGKKVICIDFDNTICLDEWPYIGPLIPGAKEVLTKLQEAGHKLILYTQRHYFYPICCKELEEYKNSEENSIYKHDNNTVDILTPALSICEYNGIVFDDINENQNWELSTGDRSRKIFMDYLIDDHVVGTRRLEVVNKFGEVCKIVDWFVIDEWCIEEGLYNESAFKCSYQDYLHDVNLLDNH